MMMSLQILTITTLLAVATAHLCMLSPPQRGSLVGFNKAGADDCFLIKGPCGTRPQADNPIYLKSNTNFTVVFQKNLNHWSAGKQGYFPVFIGNVDGSNMTLLNQVADNNEPSLHIYALNVTIPQMPKGRYIIQTQYVTKSTAAPPFFYQCGDVSLL